MELKMFIGSKLIDSKPVPLPKFKQPGYIAGLKQQIEEANESVTHNSSELPVFYLDNVFSSMHRKVIRN